jgi:hypothetical protein
MTGSTRQRPRRVPSLPTVLASVACFLVLFEFLAFQLRAGRDPVVGSSAAAPAAARPRPVVIHRRLIVRRAVEDPAANASSVTVGGSSVSESSSSGSAAPAPAAPAPAPAPAPVTSSS